MQAFIDLLSNLVVIFGIPIAISEYIKSERQRRIEHVMKSLELVGSTEQRIYRKRIYAASKDGRTRKTLTPKEFDAFEKVSVTFDRIGMYAARDRAFRKIAIENHYDIIVRCYEASEPWINDHVSDFGNKHYRFYKQLYRRARYVAEWKEIDNSDGVWKRIRGRLLAWREMKSIGKESRLKSSALHSIAITSTDLPDPILMPSLPESEDDDGRITPAE